MSERVLVEVALFTDDVEAAKRFYGQLLAMPPVSEWTGGAIFAAGGAKILVHKRTAGLENGPPGEDHFALGVADLDETCADLQRQGSTLLVEPRDYPWGRSAYLRDPDGRLVELQRL